jgi:hypothetical protein
MCLAGQCGLISLTHQIFDEHQMKIIFYNTDGILIYVKRTYLPELARLINEHRQSSGID